MLIVVQYAALVVQNIELRPFAGDINELAIVQGINHVSPERGVAAEKKATLHDRLNHETDGEIILKEYQVNQTLIVTTRIKTQ